VLLPKAKITKSEKLRENIQEMKHTSFSKPQLGSKYRMTLAVYTK
jgi:hypothetical protein